MKSIEVKGAARIVTIAGAILAVGSAIAFSQSEDGWGKSFSLNVGLLSAGVVAGGAAASYLVENQAKAETERVSQHYEDELKDNKRTIEDINTRLSSQNSTITTQQDKLISLDKLLAEKEIIIKQLKIAIQNIQTETKLKNLELDQKLQRENKDRQNLYLEMLDLFSSDLNYRIEESYNSLARTVASKLQNQKYISIQDKLQNFYNKLQTSLANSRKYLVELREVEFCTSDITDLYFQISDEISSRKVQLRNLLNTVERCTLLEFEKELEERRNPQNFVPRQKVLAALDNNDHHYSTQKQKFQAALNQEFNNLKELRESVNDLINQIDSKNLEIADLKTEINTHRSPLKWTLANSRELEIGNMIIDYFWKDGTNYYLDRSFMETDGYECKLYFQIDRNPRQIVESELNDKSEELQQFCRTLKPITFKYSGAKGLMVATVALKEKPKTDVDKSTVQRICKPHEVFAAAVGSYERWRVTGGSQAGKSPTAQYIAEAITKYSSKKVNVRLFNPQHGSKKDNWQYKAEGKNAEECLEGIKLLGEEIKNRQSKAKSTDLFDLFLVDELDSIVEEMGSGQVKSPLRYAIKQASHQDVGCIFIGQSSAANVVAGMTWSDWNSTAQLHLGDNAKGFIESRWKTENELREDYLKQFSMVRDYYERKNYEAGLTISDYGYFRFAFVAIPNQKPFFIEIPPFIFVPEDFQSVSTDDPLHEPLKKALSIAHAQADSETDCSPIAHQSSSTPKLQCHKCKSTDIKTKGDRYVCGNCCTTTKISTGKFKVK
ncbi:hypothetical protein Riv7116_6944 (plasmid) [Rivularia sp. PCC 7116]|uniref:hypothetical protein n=1 Tax=Rivularia sp. PCC 7116 TaxID=373994 RepID=UPI00029ED436|nr:hypothetical protein [Rivularia sp. PCC 7116]AFY59256.1 hypothetical protein Riv7116_6944 [Rivularia sp. PCC 7116]